MQQRGSKYDARTKEQALALIASGVSITNAAKQLQIPKSTVADWWNTQGDADEDAVAARREARRASILKCGKIVDKALAALDKRVAAAGREARDMDEGLKVLKKAAKDGVIGLSEDEVKSLQKIVQDYTGIGLRELWTIPGSGCGSCPARSRTSRSSSSRWSSSCWMRRMPRPSCMCS